MRRLFPFLNWFPFAPGSLRADLVAGTTVAMVLVPQSMAYAQLAGLPPYYGLYAAFLPVIIGALWGSSHQLATGPVALVSLLTGSTLAQFAPPGTDQFITLAITLALMVGIMELVLGVFRLGAIVNFVSHPVIVGFTNAAAIIIGLSQLNKLLGVPLYRTEHFLADMWGVLRHAADSHLPSLAMGLAALAIMIALRRLRPRWPGVLIAVALTTAVSWAIDFERNATAEVPAFQDQPVRNAIESASALASRVGEINTEIARKLEEAKKIQKDFPDGHPRALALEYDVDVLRFELRVVEREQRARRAEINKFQFELVPAEGAHGARLYLAGLKPPDLKSDGQRWRITRVGAELVSLSGGGEVVGRIPPGLPSVAMPKLDWDLIITLLSTAFVITLVGFMEAVSIAKAMATTTRQRIDPNQELVGQGLANIVGSVFQSFPVSGSFSRSAVNLSSGAVTGLSSVITGLFVLLTLLLLTPLLYHLPQAVLAAVIMMAVVNLVNVEAIRHAWKAHRHDGAAAIVTFVATLSLAPHLDGGILVGAGLAIVLYLYRTMRPRVVILGRHPDGSLRDSRRYGLATSDHIIAIRFDGPLYFANVPYFEEAVLGEVARNPKARQVLIVGDTMNELDGSGEEMLRGLVARLRDNGVVMAFSGLLLPVERVLQNTGLDRVIGSENLFRNEDLALDAILARIDDPSFDAATCPLARKTVPG